MKEIWYCCKYLLHCIGMSTCTSLRDSLSRGSVLKCTGVVTFNHKWLPGFVILSICNITVFSCHCIDYWHWNCIHVHVQLHKLSKTSYLIFLIFQIYTSSVMGEKWTSPDNCVCQTWTSKIALSQRQTAANQDGRRSNYDLRFIWTPLWSQVKRFWLHIFVLIL